MSPRSLTLVDVVETLDLMMSAARSPVTSEEFPAIQVGGKCAWRVEEAMFRHYIEEQYAAIREHTAKHSP